MKVTLEVSRVMAALGRIKSKKKAAASKANGKKGGRPRNGKSKERNGRQAKSKS